MSDLPQVSSFTHVSKNVQHSPIVDFSLLTSVAHQSQAMLLLHVMPPRQLPRFIGKQKQWHSLEEGGGRSTCPLYDTYVSRAGFYRATAAIVMEVISVSKTHHGMREKGQITVFSSKCTLEELGIEPPTFQSMVQPSLNLFCFPPQLPGFKWMEELLFSLNYKLLRSGDSQVAPALLSAALWTTHLFQGGRSLMLHLPLLYLSSVLRMQTPVLSVCCRLILQSDRCCVCWGEGAI